MNFIMFLPLILGTAIGSILILIVIPIVVPIIFKQRQQQEILTLNVHPAPPVNNDTIVKTP